jgi:hypothetical protein
VRCRACLRPPTDSQPSEVATSKSLTISHSRPLGERGLEEDGPDAADSFEVLVEGENR